MEQDLLCSQRKIPKQRRRCGFTTNPPPPPGACGDEKRGLILFSRDSVKKYLTAVIGSLILAFGLYHIHAVCDITEGGVLGLTLLLDHWFGVSPAVTGAVLNAACYLLGWRLLGKDFILCSAVCTAAFSAGFAFFSVWPPLWPGLYGYPPAAAILGALFVGVGVGLCVRVGGAASGDDALAMSISHVTGVPIEWVYLFSDLSVLALSATYIPWRRLGWSLLTVILSGQIIGLLQRLHRHSAP